MKSIILYAYSGEAPGIMSDYDQVRLPQDNEACYVFVRAEVFEGNVSSALNAAKPRPDEIVLNTIPYPTGAAI